MNQEWKISRRFGTNIIGQLIETSPPSIMFRPGEAYEWIEIDDVVEISVENASRLTITIDIERLLIEKIYPESSKGEEK